MAKPILMPQVGQDLDEGKLVEWKVKLGDTVKKGDIVAVVESEKASFEVEAFEAGTVIEMLYEEGATTKVLAPLLFVGEAGEATGGSAKPASAQAAAPTAPLSSGGDDPGTDAAAVVESGVSPAVDGAPPSAQAAPPAASPAAGSSASGAKGSIGSAAPVDAAAAVESAVRPGEVGGGASPTAAKPGRSSPLARRMAGSAGIDLKGMTGTGPGGAVVRRDIEKAMQARPAATASAAEGRQPAPVATPAAAAPAAPGGGALHRAWLRKGQGDPVVMIHGFGGDNNAWRVLAAAAGLSRPILAVDLPGHGASPAGVPSLEAMAAAVGAVLAEEGVTAADLVGHSLGAAVAVTIAESARFTVRSLFLISPAGLGPDINGDFVAGFSRARSEATLAPWMRLLVADDATIGPAFVRITHETREKPGVADAQARLAEAVFPDGTQVFSVRKALEALPMPVRIVFGTADRIIPARHASGLPGTVALHLFPGIGHMPFIEAREPVARLLGEHLRSVA